MNHGINTVRGAAADCLATLLFHDQNRWPLLEKATYHVVFDQSWSVRAVSVHCLTAMLNFNRDTAVKWFVEADGKSVALLGSMFVPRFLQFASQSHYDQLRDILQGMVKSENGDTREAGAQAIAIASFRVNEALEDLKLVRSATDEARASWMEVAAENVRNPTISARCREWLKEGFFDTSPKVRDVASRCFHKLSSDQLCAETDLINSFLESPAFEHDSTFLLMALEKAVDRLPDIVCRIPERALAIFRDADDDGHRPWWTHQMSTLVLRLYNQTRDPKIRSRCLDAIDSMIELGSWEVATELEKIERV